MLAALAVLFGVCHNRVWLCVRAYLPTYAADGALAPLVETTPVSDPRSTHCNLFRDSGRVLVFPGGVRCHLTAVLGSSTTVLASKYARMPPRMVVVPTVTG